MTSIAKTYPSKTTYWIYLPVIFFFLYFLLSTVRDAAWITMTALATVSGLILFPLLFNTRYIISNEVLNIKSGFVFKVDIDIQKIKKIAPNSTIWSAPALSFDRIEVFYNTYDSIIISPKNKKDFIETLKQINPTIVSEV
jgi:hypothetical protein